MNPPESERIYYPALDGIRGIAIILVLLYHNFSFIEYFNYGWIGVDFFFVLSGFLITTILLNNLKSGNYYKNFYTRRVLRILPLYYLSLVLFLLVLPAIKGFTLDMSYYRENQLWFWLYLQNWTLIFNEGGNAHALDHYWSLAIEEQYYLLWPLIIMWIKRPKWILIVCITMLLLIIGARLYIWNNREELSISYLRLFLFTRLDGIIIGSMLAIIFYINSKLIRKYFTGFIILLTVANYLFYLLIKKQNPDFPTWGVAGYTTFSFLFAIVIYEAVMKENRLINSILTIGILRFLGKYSYGFYIFHWPVFLMFNPFFTELTSQLFERNSLGQMITSALLSTIVGLIVSILSYHLFEIHFLKLKKRFNTT